MIGTFQKERRFGWLVGLSLIILIVSLYSEYIFSDDLFIFRGVGSDTYAQYWPFDRLFGSILRNGDWTQQWTFNIGVGQQIFPQVAWLNPFRLLIHLAPTGLEAYLYILKMVLEIVCAVLLWRFYMRKLGVHGHANAIFALLYGFNGYLLLWGQHANFGVVFSLIPLTLYAFESFLQDGKRWPLILALTFFLMISIYFFTMFMVFFVLFAAARLLHQSQTFASATRQLVPLAACGIIAGLLAAWVILPEGLFYLQSPRVGNPINIRFWSLFGWMHQLSLMRIFSNNIFGTGLHYYGLLNYYEAPQLYCGLFTLLMIPQFFVSSDRKGRWLYGTILLILTAALFSPFLAHLFNARFTLNNRYTFVLITFWIFLAALSFWHIEQKGTLHRPLFGVSWGLLFLLVAIPLTLVLLIEHNLITLSKDHLRQWHYFIDRSHPNLSRSQIPGLLKTTILPTMRIECLKVLALLSAYGVLFLLFAQKRVRSLKWVWGVVLAEIIILSYPTINERATLEAKDLHNGRGYFDGTVSAVKYIQSIDSRFYRIAKTYQSVYLNDSAFQGYRGTRGYGSLTEPVMIRFYQQMKIPYYRHQKSSNYQGGFDNRPHLNDLVGVKYLLSKEPLKRSHLVFLKQINEIYIYQNRRALPLGFAYPAIWDNSAFKKLSSKEKDRALLAGAVVNDETVKQHDLTNTPRLTEMPPKGHLNAVPALPSNQFKVSAFRPNYIAGQTELSQTALYFLSIPYNKGWKILIDKKPVETLPVNFGFTGVSMPAGRHTVECTFRAFGQTEGILISGVTLLCLLGYCGITKMRGNYS